MTESRAVLSAREELEDALKLLDDADIKIQALSADTPDEERDFHKAVFERAQKTVDHAGEKLERAIAIQKAKEAIPPMADEDPTEEEQRKGFAAGTLRVKEPLTYRKDNWREVSFIQDVANAGVFNDPSARERLDRHAKEMGQKRDVTAAGAAAGSVPPLYMGDLWAELPRESRPFADAVAKAPLPDTGLSITIPRITTGTAVAVQQTEADTVTETDADDTLLTVGVRLIAGQQDLSIQAFERTQPGWDAVIASDLRDAYDAYLDTQLISGTGSNAQHLGVRAVSSVNTVTYTDASPTGPETVGPIYDAIQKVYSNRHAPSNLILMHPRRAAFLAAGGTASVPIIQQGTLNQAYGTQDNGFLRMFAGHSVVIDSNVGTTYGNPTNSNQDEVYVCRSSDLILMEGELRVRALPEVLSGTLQVRLQVFAYSAFVSGRYPSGITVLSGTGFASPTF